MNNIILKYLIDGFFKNFLKVVLFFFCFGIILNLFEEIEFFKNLNVSIFVPLFLTILFIPSILIQLLPFIIFVTSMKFVMDIRNNKDLLNIKVFGFSNFKIFFILAITSFLIGWVVLFFINPITSSMSQYYDKTKSGYSKDIVSKFLNKLIIFSIVYLDSIVIFSNSNFFISCSLILNNKT